VRASQSSERSRNPLFPLPDDAGANVVKFQMIFGAGFDSSRCGWHPTGNGFQKLADTRGEPPERASPSCCSSLALGHFVVPLSVKATLSLGRYSDVVTRS
jgi:hypothetical protein